MKILHNQAGSSHIAALLAIGVIVVVGAVGYRVMNSTETVIPTPAATVSSQPTKVPDTISSNVDLKKAGAALDSTNIDGGVNANQLNNDLD